MKHWIQGNFTIILILGVLAGLFMPGMDTLPDYAAIILIASVIFFSCARVSFDEMKTFDKRSAGIFFVLRFLVFPAAMYFIALPIIPQYAVGVLLVSLMPVGVASSAMCNITGGNASIALPATVITNALTPFIVPLMIGLCAGAHIEIDVMHMLVTLVLSVFIPAALYFLVVRRMDAARNWTQENAGWMSILLIGGMATAVIGMRREYFFTDWQTLAGALAVGCVLYGIYYVIGWFYAAKMPLREKKTYAIMSGSNNVALSAAVAVLYFSDDTVLFTIVGGEIAWIVGVDMFKRFAVWKDKQLQSLSSRLDSESI